MDYKCTAGKCDIGMYCYKSRCAKMAKFDGSCTSDEQCQPSQFCSFPSSICIDKYLFIPGSKADKDYMCESGHAYHGVCVSTSTLVSEYLLDSEQIKSGCTYDGDRKEDGECIKYSGNNFSAGFCKKYHGEYMKHIRTLKDYIRKYKPDMCPETDMFCDFMLDQISSCDARRVLEAVTYHERRKEEVYPECIDKEATMSLNVYTCFSSGLMLGALSFLVLVFLIL